jgi:hypothetical protein
MHRSAPGRLRRLRDLAAELYEVVSAEFGHLPHRIEFSGVADLAEANIDKEHLVAATLLCAQLLHRATADPELTRPRHIQTLADIIDQVLPELLGHTSDAPGAEKTLRALGAGIADQAFNLVMLADPDSPTYEGG